MTKTDPHREEKAMTPIRPRRSALYMPGSNARAIEKARTLAADAVIFDLEDAVAPDAKAAAREEVCAAVQAGGYGKRELVIRINALETPWGEADLAAAIAAAPDAILVPKVSSAETLAAVGLRLRKFGAAERTRIWAMIETPLAILRAESIASAAHDVDTRLSCFVMGALAAARAHGIDILDGVYNSLSDKQGFRAECEQGRDCGFDGKTLIHPDQIAVANEVFAPSEGEVENARAIVAA